MRYKKYRFTPPVLMSSGEFNRLKSALEIDPEFYPFPKGGFYNEFKTELKIYLIGIPLCLAALQFLDDGIIFGFTAFCLIGLCISFIGTLISMASFWLYIQERDGYFIRITQILKESKDYNEFRSRMNK